MEGEKIRILLIEDNPGDARLIRELLSRRRGGFILTWNMLTVSRQGWLDLRRVA